MRDLLVALIAWAAQHTGLPPAPPPPVLIMPHATVVQMYCHDQPLHRPGQACVVDNDGVQAFYNREGRYIVLGDNWDVATDEGRAVVLHELVHHLQAEAGREYPCQNAREAEAYEAGNAYLAERGLPPQADPLWVELMASCNRFMLERGG